MAKELASQKGWFSAITGSGKPTTESPQTAGKLAELSESDWKKVGESVINLYTEKLSDLEETKNVCLKTPFIQMQSAFSFGLCLDHNNTNQLLAWEREGKAHFDFEAQNEGHFFAHGKQVNVLADVLQ